MEELQLQRRQFVLWARNVRWVKFAHAEKGMSAVEKRGYGCMHKEWIQYGVQSLGD